MLTDAGVSATVTVSVLRVQPYVATFKEFPPRSYPPSFNPANIMEETLDDIKDARKKAAPKPK